MLIAVSPVVTAGRCFPDVLLKNFSSSPMIVAPETNEFFARQKRSKIRSSVLAFVMSVIFVLVFSCDRDADVAPEVTVTGPVRLK